MVIVNFYATVRDLPELAFPHTENSRRDLTDPQLPEHLDGFSGYVLKMGGGEMTAHLYHLIQHIQRVRHTVSVNMEREQLPTMASWAAQANAVVFLPDGTVRDPHGRVLLDPSDGSNDPQAKLPYPQDALARRARSVARLQRMNVSVPESLPPIVSAQEASLRAPAEVAQRALALMVVALRAESLNNGDPWAVPDMRKRFPQGFAAFSPTERNFMLNAAPERQAVINHAWRYEALALLLWALQLTEELPLPTAICDVKATVEAATRADAETMIANARLRDVNEILDAADLHYRLHWATRQAVQIDKTEPPASLEPGVIVERRHALNWLLRFQEAEWDRVDTPT